MAMRFWELKSTVMTSKLAEPDFEAMNKLKDVYPRADGMPRSKRDPNIPVHILLTSKRITDFVSVWMGRCIVQDRVLRLFREEGFTGFDMHLVSARMKVRGMREKPLDPCDERWGLRPREAASVQVPVLWELLTRGWGGMAPPESGIRLIEGPSDAPKRLRYSAYTDASHLIDEAQWDGSDFFMVWPMPGHIFVTDRVARFIRKNKLTGAKLIRSDKLVFPSFLASQSFSPGRLSHWLPDPRAREIGEPLGIY